MPGNLPSRNNRRQRQKGQDRVQELESDPGAPGQRAHLHWQPGPGRAQRARLRAETSFGKPCPLVHTHLTWDNPARKTTELPGAAGLLPGLHVSWRLRGHGGTAPIPAAHTRSPPGCCLPAQAMGLAAPGESGGGTNGRGMAGAKLRPEATRYSLGSLHGAEPLPAAPLPQRFPRSPLRRGLSLPSGPASHHSRSPHRQGHPLPDPAETFSGAGPRPANWGCRQRLGLLASLPCSAGEGRGGGSCLQLVLPSWAAPQHSPHRVV